VFGDILFYRLCPRLRIENNPSLKSSSIEGKNRIRLGKRTKWIAAALIMLLITIGAGAYAQDYGKNEIVHFWVAVPAGEVKEAKIMRGAGPPVSLSPIQIDLNARGVLKNLIQPNVEALSTHWIYNLGQKPVRIQMELVNCSIPVKWEVNANFPYDPETHTFIQPLMPGKSIPNLGLDWIFDIPTYESTIQQGTEGLVYNGGLLLTNADTGERLTLIPIKIGYGQASFSSAAGCCD
jgi:hypothetical protein